MWPSRRAAREPARQRSRALTATSNSTPASRAVSLCGCHVPELGGDHVRVRGITSKGTTSPPPRA
jgi:hypothetical protein